MRIREEEMRMGLKMIFEILNVPAFFANIDKFLNSSLGYLADTLHAVISLNSGSFIYASSNPIYHYYGFSPSVTRTITSRCKRCIIISAYIYSHPFAHPVPYHSKCIIRSSFSLTSHFFYRFCVSNKRLCNVWVVSYNARSDT